MKELLLGAMLLTIPSIAGSGTYSVTESINQKIELCGGEIRVTPQKPIVRDIASFAMKDGNLSEKEALEFGHSLANTFAPKRLAAIASKESNFRKTAVSPDGHDKGAYQVREKEWGKVPQTISSQTKQAEKVLLEKMADARGSLDEATVRYNGFNEKARKYGRDVKRIERLI